LKIKEHQNEQELVLSDQTRFTKTTAPNHVPVTRNKRVAQENKEEKVVIPQDESR